jgi:hypothetical protein
MFIVARIGDDFAESGWPKFFSKQGDTVLLVPVYYTTVG